MAQIERVFAISDDLISAFERLIPQLSPNGVPPTRDELAEIVASPNVYLYVARSETSEIIGSMTLAFYRTPTALHAWIEDVIVDETARGQGIGAALTKIAIQQASQRGAKCINLTSRPARVAANLLYQKLGFDRWETNAYRYDLSANIEAHQGSSE